MASRRIQTFVWCALKRKILSRVELNRRGILNSSDDLFYTLCGSQEENVDHLFGKCSVVRCLWSRFANVMEASWNFYKSCVGIVESWVISNLRPKDESSLEYCSGDYFVVRLE